MHRSARTTMGTTRGGYVMLLSVIVLGAVGTAIAVSLLTIGIASSRTSFAAEQMYEAKALASGCVEEGLRRIRSSVSFTGAGTLAFADGACTYSVVNTGGQNRTVSATGTVGTVVRKARVTITVINPVIAPSTWQEIAD